MNTTAPENVGFSSARLRRLDALMQRYVDERWLPGVLTVVSRHGKVAYCECAGLMDIESQKPVQVDTIFRIYSMTKPITSVAVMMLYEEGCLQLNEPVAKYIPAFGDLKVFVSDNERADCARPMTIRHLLTHTSGLTYDFLGDSPVDQMCKEAELHRRDASLQEMIDKLARLPLVHQPGSAWRYSMATDVLGYLVQGVSGMPFDEFLRERILQPLGMVDTDFYAPEAKLDRLATLYGSNLQVVDPARGGEYARRPRLSSGGGGLVSTAPDYLRFCQMMLNGGALDGVRILGRKTVELMTMNHLSPELMPIRFPDGPVEGVGFGLGFSVVTDVAATQVAHSVGSYGWGGAASTLCWIDPVEDMIVIMMTQLMTISEDETPPPRRDFGQDMRAVVYQALVD